ncbi:MAG: DUF3817 domain-containing protein [Actinomycetales bacterium]|nr:DUF3817 domain-containing protein [Actinomycetales bacterium]
MSMYPTTLATPVQIRKALGLYRVMAIVAGLALFILVVEMVMKYGMAQENWFTKNWSYIHGFVYMAYAATIANLGLKLAWGLKRIVLHLLSGFVPLAPFFAERKVTGETERILARLY